MEDNVEKMNLAFKQIFESFKSENLKDSQRGTLQNQVKVKMCSLVKQRGLENHWFFRLHQLSLTQ